MSHNVQKALPMFESETFLPCVKLQDARETAPDGQFGSRFASCPGLAAARQSGIHHGGGGALTLGIGVNTSIFSLYNAWLWGRGR